MVQAETRSVGDVAGVECGVCHGETFRTLEREVRMKVKVCPRCARRLDAERQPESDAEAMKNMTKAERRHLIQEKSHDWARSWAGKHVMVTYCIDGLHQLQGAYHGEMSGARQWQGPPQDLPLGGYLTYHIKGMAADSSRHEDVGYGRVDIVIDESELGRLTWMTEGYEDAFPGSRPQKVKFRRPEPVIDGFRWGLGRHLHSHGRWNEEAKDHDWTLDTPVGFEILWGDRNRFELEEMDEATEQRLALAEEERRRRAEEEEARRHMGEGI